MKLGQVGAECGTTARTQKYAGSVVYVQRYKYHYFCFYKVIHEQIQYRCMVDFAGRNTEYASKKTSKQAE